MRGIKNAVLPRGRSSVAGALIATSVLVVAAIVAVTSVQAQGMRGPAMHVDMHGDMHGGEMGGSPMMFGGPPEHVGRIVDRMLDGLNATEAQRAQVKQIAVAAATDLRAQANAGRTLRSRGVQVFAAPMVDASAAESLRQEALAQHDTASKRVLQAMLDIAKVLTPEQRAKMAERLRLRETIQQERMGRMHRDHPAPMPK